MSRLRRLEPSAQQESAEIWEGVESAVESDVFVAELEAKMDFRVSALVVEQVVQRSGRTVLCLDFQWYKTILVTNEEVHLQLRI